MQISRSLPTSYPKPAPAPEKDWTVLYVFNGDNDLKENTTYQLKQLANAGAPEDSYVAAFSARGDLEWKFGNIARKARWHVDNMIHGKNKPQVDAPWEGNRVFHINEPGDLPEPLAAPEGKVSQPATIDEFLEWGMKTYPSKHVAVIFSGHGDGHRGVLMDGGGKEMPITEFGKVLEKAQEVRGKPIDLVGLESCNMAQAEVAYELHDSAKALVASPSVLTGTPWDHQAAVKSITSAQNGREAAINLVEAATNFGKGTPTISAIDLERMPNLRDALGELGDSLLEGEVPDSTLERMIYNSRSYGYAEQNGMKPQRELVDIGSFCDQLKGSGNADGSSYSKAAEKVQEELKEATRQLHQPKDEPRRRLGQLHREALSYAQS